MGFAEEELFTILGESVEGLHARTGDSSRWLQEVEGAWDEVAAREPLPWPPLEGRAREQATFLPLVEPLIRQAHERLLAGIRDLTERFPEAPFTAREVSPAFLGHLPPFLGPMLTRTMVVELQVASLEQRLAGTTPEERFEEFVDSLRGPDVALEILRQYPVLARQVVEHLERWVGNALQFLTHLATDAVTIRKLFIADEPSAGEPSVGEAFGTLVEVEGGLSDPHRGGKGVFILRFDCGRRLVYKPRSLAVDAAFQELLQWLSEHGLEPGFRALKILDAGDHGWAEHVEAMPCASAEELRRFFWRQGAYIGLLYLLGATDFHHENLIAEGEHPVLVDLETLFHPFLAGRRWGTIEETPGEAHRDSVLRSGLVPQRIWGDREHAGVDLSGLTVRPGQLTPMPVLTTTDRGTDRMRFERRRLEIPVATSRPSLNGQEVSALGHLGEIIEGFTHLGRLLIRHRDVLGAPGGPLAAFASAEVRVLLRQTAAYGTLLIESLHPHWLGDAAERERFFDRLWGAVGEQPALEPIVPLEIRDLTRGDVPHFVTRPGCRDLWASDGEHFAGFLPESGLERVERRLQRLSEDDLERQVAALRAAFDVVRLSEQQLERPRGLRRESRHPAESRRLLAASRRIGDRLVRLAFRGAEGASWLSLNHREPVGWELAPVGPDLYSGLSGIAFFLAHLGALTGEGTFTELAREAISACRWQLAEEPERLPGVGAFSGWGGIVYTLLQLGVLWGDEGLLDEAESVLDRLPRLVEEDRFLDLIAGSAGCLLPLLALAEHRPSQRLEELARRCGERLLATTEPQARGVGWVMPIAGPRPLAGISHGAAGAALALLRLGAVTGDERFHRTALAGIEYERSLFSPEEGNWPDLRAGAADFAGLDAGGEHFMNAWCHGAPGIGLARLAGLPCLDDAAVRQEIAVAVATTLEHGFGGNHSLCHGDLGNLDFLLAAARAADDSALLHRVYRLAGGILDRFEADEAEGWLSGLPGGVEVPGLMVGLAGIGYGLARLAVPDRLPCLLTLQSPPRSAAGEA